MSVCKQLTANSNNSGGAENDGERHPLSSSVLPGGQPWGLSGGRSKLLLLLDKLLWLLSSPISCHWAINNLPGRTLTD